MLSWDLKGPRTHSLEGSSGRPRGTQSSKTSSNRKDGDPPPIWDGDIRVEHAQDSSSGDPRVYTFTTPHSNRGTAGLREEAPSPGGKVTPKVRPRGHSKLPQKKGGFVSSAITDLNGEQTEGSGRGQGAEAGHPHRCAWGRAVWDLPRTCSHPTPLGRPWACVRGNIVEETKATFNSVFKSYFPRSKSYLPSTAGES